MPLAKRFDTLFLDRDGVLNKKIDHGYVLTFDQIEILPGVKEFLETAQHYFKRILVVSNQRCVGRGLLSMEKLSQINAQINNLTGNCVDRFYICPHLDEENCICRKPKNGLFMFANDDYGVDFKNSWMIGDSETDLIPARQLKITTFYRSAQHSVFADRNIDNLSEMKVLLEGLTV